MFSHIGGARLTLIRVSPRVTFPNTGPGERALTAVAAVHWVLAGLLLAVVDHQPRLAESRFDLETRRVEPVETAYARSGDLSIAYQVLGEGPPDLVYISHTFNHLELDWEHEPSARFYRRLASISRLLRFDKRGTGMSDRPVELPSLDTRMDDVRAVLDAVGSERAVLFATGDGGFLGTVFAATYPERTAGLVLFNSTPRFTRSPDMPWLRTRAEQEELIQGTLRAWGNLEDMVDWQMKHAPHVTTREEAEQYARRARLSHSPAAVAAYLLPNLDLDVRDVLPAIRVPTLVMYRTVPQIPLEQSARYLAQHIPGARLVELPPDVDISPAWGKQDVVFPEFERFLAELAEEGAREIGPDRVLATILFTDLVDSTARASELGDRRWRELVEQHHRLIRTQLGYFRGREMDTAGDGFFATFDGPARAIRCACAIRDSVRELGLEVRAGLHTGECELVDGKVGGIAVHIGARVATAAQPGEVLVSRTVRDLVAGSGIALHDRGQHSLKGVHGEWELYAVTIAAEPDF
jgi:class 3 adenylate cyclase/pimeloyl-ACP methyl ester carboxylesterase